MWPIFLRKRRYRFGFLMPWRTWAPKQQTGPIVLHYKTEGRVHFNLYPWYREYHDKTRLYSPAPCHYLKNPTNVPCECVKWFIAWRPSKDNLSDAIKSLVSEQIYLNMKKGASLSLQAMQNGQFIALKAVCRFKTGRPLILKKMQSWIKLRRLSMPYIRPSS